MIFSVLSRSKEKPNQHKKMIINVVHPEESRVAIVDNGVLQELSMETAQREKLRGNIYKGIVQKVEQSLHAAFVEYGGNRPGFLPLDEVHASYHAGGAPAEKAGPPAGKILHKGQEVIVQISKDEKASKGAALTTYVSLPGRYLVLMPGYRRTGISRKIEDAEERKKLKDIGQQLKIPESMGFIIRTAGLNKNKKELQADANYLLRLWKAVQSRSRDLKAPCLLYQESSMVMQAIRDYFTTDISEVLIDNLDMYRKAREFFRQILPKHQKIVKLYEDPEPIFMKYGVEEQIEPLYKRVVPLKSGSSISIDPTEALVSIDVNTARFTRVKDPEESALMTNLEAADEIARQLKLRDLGGLIVIDFIDMRDMKKRSQVEKHLRQAFKSDKANVEFSRISKFGLLEMSREHLRSPLFDNSHVPCPHCAGLGKLRSRESVALMVLREVYHQAALGAAAEIQVVLAGAVAEYLQNEKRAALCAIEKQFNVKISIAGTPKTPEDSYTIENVPRA
jgi:ribonuclease E